MTILFGLFLIIMILGWRRRWLPWRRPPFKRSFPQIRRAIRNGEMESAFQIFHHALNDTAGSALFINQLPDFFQKQPEFAALEKPLEQFFQDSTRLFFGGKADPDALNRLETLCHACIRMEKRCQR